MARKTVFHTLLGKLERRVGTLPAGAVLPAEQTLADEYVTSKPTLRRALAELAQRGLILKRNGVGNIVLNSRSVMRRELVFLCNNINFYSQTLSAFGAAIRRENYFLSIVPLDGDAFTQTQIIETVVERAPSGLVVSADQAHNDLPIYRTLAAGPVPLLFLARLPEGVGDASLIAIDNRREFSRIVRRLYREGCRRFALYGWSTLPVATASERVAGFYDGMRSCRLRPQERLQCLAPEQLDDFLHQFRSPATAPDAVCCLNDGCAVQLIDLLNHAGIDCKTIRFSGFDNLPLLQYFPNRILTVKLPFEELGRTAAEMLMRQIENRGFKPFRKLISAEILEE